MPDLIENLRKKPERERRRITVLVSLGITAIIFLVWLSIVWNGFKRDVKEEEDTRQERGPISSLFDNFKVGSLEVLQEI